MAILVHAATFSDLFSQEKPHAWTSIRPDADVTDWWPLEACPLSYVSDLQHTETEKSKCVQDIYGSRVAQVAPTPPLPI